MEHRSQCLYNGNSCPTQNMEICALYKIWQLVPKCHIMASVHRRVSQSSFRPSELPGAPPNQSSSSLSYRKLGSSGCFNHLPFGSKMTTIKFQLLHVIIQV